MPKLRALLLLSVPLLIPQLLIAATDSPKRPQPASPEEKVRFFTAEVLPILEKHCFPCHSGSAPMGKLDLTTREGFLKGGVGGPSVKLDAPDKSLFLHAVNYQGKQMPPSGKLPDKQIQILSRWVKEGLAWPESGDGGGAVHHGPPQVNAENKKFWSFQPVKRPAPPAVKIKAWARGPIDAFVLKRLEAAGLAPNPPAEKVALLRRATYDLTGLPPTPEEVKAFLADPAPDAYEKVVDRLLASPRYGEKWGRHWLDLVRYAETNSYERDGTKPNAWRYRDYVIDSFNRDKPYSQFLTEQLAGDELSPATPERLVATGYYRLGVWDDEPADPKQALYDDLDNIVGTTSQVFLGLTADCARCHDHKLDPFPQKDYYSLLAFFNGVERYSYGERSQKPIASEAEQKRYESEIAAHEVKLKRIDAQREGIESKVLEDLVPVEKEEWKHANARPQILKMRVPRLLSQAEYDRYLALGEERKALDAQAPKGLAKALVVTEEKAPRETFVLLRGNPHVEGEKVAPAFPSVLSPPAPAIAPPPSGESSGRRLALAKWLASETNPLTARVFANRIWQYHFGRGIVRSPNNFGLQGDRPTHPEMLDWLASELIANGWRMKPLHKQIMLSSTYRMSSRANPMALAKDPENDLFWRFDMRRLAAEEIRDSILAANGSLNPKAGGPSIYPDIPEEVLAGQSRPGEGWGKSPPEEQRRRSVYIFAKRSLMTPILASFDGPEPDFTCPVRFTTTQPTQALGMLNSAFTNEQARVFAETLRKQAGNDPVMQVKLALWRVLQRPPIQSEIRRGLLFMDSLRKEKPGGDALASFCLLTLNLNEFVYLD